MEGKSSECASVLSFNFPPEGLLYGSRCGVKAQCAAVLLAGGSAVCEAFSCQEY